jgi:hypothetical protein
MKKEKFTELELIALKSLNAIVARIDGYYDNPDLKEFGPLGFKDDDIKAIAKKALDAGLKHGRENA